MTHIICQAFDRNLDVDEEAKQFMKFEKFWVKIDEMCNGFIG